MKKVTVCPEPKRVFEIFKEFSAVPHGSYHTEKATEFCINSAKKLGLDYKTDNVGNVIIYKNGTPGFENNPPVILQGHIDMVCEKLPEKEIDFLKDGIEIFTDGEYIFADGTTLGGDDGIAVAMILAVLEDNSIAHPPIEAVFTVNEETGMEGAVNLDCSLLKGKTMINLDSEDENVLWVSCAGGIKNNITFPVKRESTVSNNKIFKIRLTSLAGGHSGTDIDKNRHNAVKTLAEFLYSLDISELYEFKGGSKDNVIPNEAFAVIGFNDKNILKEKAETFLNKIKSECNDDKNADIIISETSENILPISESDCKNILEFIKEAPFGVIAMSKSIKGLVETSLNLGTLKFNETEAVITFSLRSGVDEEKNKLCEKMKALTEKHSGTFFTHGEYPAWEYKEISRIRDIIKSEYGKLYNKSPEVQAVHAGLECGIFYKKIENLDCVSIGPDIFDIHTPKEKLSVKSVQRIYNLLLNVLKEL